ncbi:glycosyltransferase family 87 protein [Dysgonomonas sp. ZJ709]|uniref:glycosyltransferase family 87 protein n=1 Tax=Dysgonomonas sp. ZJ709 TaxID=2709797 RepID=UPI0013E9DC64|nr:glycosyltransferase family 87 protein [Dysgonomonas sp. ZJ709]
MGFITRFFQRPIFSDKRFVFSIWILVALFAGLKHALNGVNNNYLIFKYVFYNTLDQVNLYAGYADKYFDVNHYGPIFSLVIAPFALLPDSIGTILWEVCIAITLLIAIYKLPIIWKGKVIIYWIALHELYVNATNSNTNTLIAALIIGTFICIKSQKEFWAACFITLGLFIKLYGVVGLAFFFFSKNKIKLIGYLFLWSFIFFVLPMLISSPQFVVQSYIDWYNELIVKNDSNTISLMQNISVIGMIRKIGGLYEISTLVIILPAMFLFALQYIQVRAYSNPVYQFGILASTLMFVVLFSSGSETCTYIIAITGAVLWFLIQKKPYSKYVMSLFIITIIITICAGSDIAPAFIRSDIIRPYALKALPYFIVWLTLIYQLVTFRKSETSVLSNGYITDNK